MIPIRYKNQRLPKFEAFVDSWITKVRKLWLANGYIGNGATRVTIDDKSRKIIQYLLSNNRLQRWIHADAILLPRIVQHMEHKFPELREYRLGTSESCCQYEVLKKMFRDLGYQDFNSDIKYEIYTAFGIRACPYCNAEYTVAVRDLDHFYPKGVYPYLAMCLNNFVPSCRYCNKTDVKGEKDTYKYKWVSPHTISDSNGVHFYLDIDGKGIMDLQKDQFEKDTILKVLVKDNAMEVNMLELKVQNHYSCYMNKARAVWWHYLTHNPSLASANSDKVAEAFGKKRDMYSDFDIALSVSEDYNQEPFSKMSYDLYKDFILGGMLQGLQKSAKNK